MAADGVSTAYEEGLELLAAGEYFAAHEAFERSWRAASLPERDFFQGLVHVSVTWYQASRDNPVGFERQREKARRRLARFGPVHRTLDVADLLGQVESAADCYPRLPPVRISRAR